MKVLGREQWQVIFSKDGPSHKSLILHIPFVLSS